MVIEASKELGLEYREEVNDLPGIASASAGASRRAAAAA
jgi:hypothetical protein